MKYNNKKCNNLKLNKNYHQIINNYNKMIQIKILKLKHNKIKHKCPR